MNKVILVLKHEVFSLTSRFSFWFGIFGLPLIGFLVLTAIGWINHSQGVNSSSPSPLSDIGQAFTEKQDVRPQGYVDHSGILKAFPKGFPTQMWLIYTDDQTARADLDSGKISAYYVIPQNYIKTGLVTVYMQQFRLVTEGDAESQFTWLLNYNLLGQNDTLTNAVDSPILKLNKTSIAPPEAGLQRSRDGMWSFTIPYVVMMLFYTGILGSAGMLLNGISKEKENRIMEVLLVSMKPYEMLLGKVTGMGIIGLFQIVVWMVSAASLLTLSGQTFTLPPEVQLPKSLIAWGVLFFILGYLVYATLMAGLGALVPNMREASQATILVILPLMIPLFLISALIENPDGGLAVGLSLFPLTAPTTMMLRLSATGVPLWQTLLSAALLVVTAFFIIRAVSNMFRAQLLLSGQPFKVKRFFWALVGK